VFVSYSSRDRERVFSIADRLAGAGVRLWLDRQKIDGGMKWADAIVRGIKGSKVLMLMCSDAAMQSRAVKQEIQLAWKYDLAYLPLLLERTSFPEQLEFFLEGCQWVEVLDGPSEQWLPALLRSLTSIGIDCSVLPTALDASPLIQPTRAARGLEGLYAVAKFTDRIWPLVVEGYTREPQRHSYTVRDPGQLRDGARHQIPLGSRGFLALDWDQEAHLLLINEGCEGKTYCLCPSWFVPDMRLHPGLSLFPPASARCEPFVITGMPGREKLLAIVTQKQLGLPWMPPDPSVPARILDDADVAHLLKVIDGLEPGSWTALATYYDVTV
jgi:hypothetical protein